VPAKLLAIKPDNVTFEQAAAVPTSGYIAMYSLASAGSLAGRSVLINGAGGCMGALAIQIAKADGARVTAVDRTDKLQMMRSLGADHVIDYTKEDVLKGGERYDYILDVASTLWFDICAPILTPGGTYVPIGHADFGRATGRMGGRVLGSLPLFISLRVRALLDSNKRKNMKMLGRPEAMARFKALLESGQLTPIIGRTYSLGEVAAAMRDMEDGRSVGRLIITPQA
jgi:NADPH:quinone reductase-like Zn-dependent oxidoreductase